ncbi:MAG: tRNA pseudouridine(38-40) synthase TruA [Phycisphaerae bacterium]|jgi:tRNA pseudouridine38-40 synthase
MERNVKLIVAYDGTEFHGWQIQPGLRTVQGVLQDAVCRVVRQPTVLVGASRTDAGVHARGQVAQFRTTAPIPPESLRRALEHRLPDDLAVVHVTDVAAAFHATRAAVGKRYRYRLYNAPRECRPVRDHDGRFCWHVWYRLDLDRMRSAAALLVGRHDFAGMANLGAPRETTVRTVTRIGIEQRYHEVLIDVEGDGFLYNQVRIMVGTLIEIGRGHWPPERIAEILATGDRSLAGPTVPPHGLTLEWVRYGVERGGVDGA